MLLRTDGDRQEMTDLAKKILEIFNYLPNILNKLLKVWT